MRDTLWNRFKSLFTNDPKPIFDHFRNMGISSAMIVGPTMILHKMYEKITFPTEIKSFDDLIAVACFIMIFTGVTIAILNIQYAYNSLRKFVYGRKNIYSIRKQYLKIGQIKKLKKAKRLKEGTYKSISAYYIKSLATALLVYAYNIILYSFVAIYVIKEIKL